MLLINIDIMTHGPSFPLLDIILLTPAPTKELSGIFLVIIAPGDINDQSPTMGFPIILAP